MKYAIGIIIALLLIAGGWFLVNQNTPSSNSTVNTEKDSLVIATSVYPLEFIFTEIAGEYADVVNVGAGADPHDFQPTTQNIATLNGADLVALQGADLEPWGEKISAQLATAGVPVFVATKDIALHAFEEDGHEEHDEHGDEHHDEEGHDEHHDEETHKEDDHDDHGDEHHDEEEHDEHEDEHAHGEFDPHVWLDPVLLSEVVGHATEALTDVDPAHTSKYESNAQELQVKLGVLHSEYEATLSRCTLDEVITSHDAFGYVADRYDIEIHSIGGLSTQDTPSAVILAELKEEAEEGVGAILLEANSVSAYGETLARETGLQTLSVSPIAYVSGEENYFSLMRSNLVSLSTALQCNE